MVNVVRVSQLFCSFYMLSPYHHNIGYSLPRARTNGGELGAKWRSFWVSETRRMFWPAERLPAAQEALCSEVNQRLQCPSREEIIIEMRIILSNWRGYSQSFWVRLYFAFLQSVAWLNFPIISRSTRCDGIEVWGGGTWERKTQYWAREGTASVPF